MNPEFEVGDIVRLTTGEAHMEVWAVYSRSLTARYLVESQYWQKNRRKSDFILVERKDHKMTNQLYQVIGTQDFGTMLAKTSDGKFVLELKPTGEIKTFDPKEIEEVLPYTIRLTGRDDNVTVDVIAKKGVVEVGDFVFDGPGFKLFRVSAIDTKSRKAVEKHGLMKLLTEPL
jgi:hypothetical protein